MRGYGGQGYGGYPQPEYGGYPQPEYSGYPQPEYGGYHLPEYGGYSDYGYKPGMLKLKFCKIFPLLTARSSKRSKE